MNFFIFTTGCKSNQWDSYVIAGNLKKKGLTPGSVEHAEMIIVNGCTLTEKAETDIRRFIQRARSVNPEAKVVLTGCHAQVYPERPFGADLVLGQKEKLEIGDLLGETGCKSERTRDFPLEEIVVNGLFRDRTRFFFKIQDGCDRFCTYCIVPYARGRARSRPAADIVETMVRLKERGVQEVVLTGIDIASYKDPQSGCSFKGLLRLLESVDTPTRIRLSSVDPACIDDELAETMGASKKLARSIHIPLQSADANVLKRMGRSYSQDDIRSMVSTLQRQVRDIGIGMDVMVGFPGEDNDAFMETYRFLESLPIFYLHVFPYSDREGTKASLMDDKVGEADKKDRVRKLKNLDGAKREAFYRRFLGERVSIIPEGKLYKGRFMRGYSEQYLPIHIPYQKELENNLIIVRIERMEGNILIGR
ncbi:MAG: tRNA (N(6)-L-threonylcarbamoyladenosine(37)-C(2))-methylthiotransferase MtaB [Syntrophorhabdales bacterium]